MCEESNLDKIQRQAALAGGLYGQSFDIPGLALTLNLKPELGKKYSSFLDYEKKNRSDGRYRPTTSASAIP